MPEHITATLTCARWVRIDIPAGGWQHVTITQQDARELRDALTELLQGSHQ